MQWRHELSQNSKQRRGIRKYKRYPTRNIYIYIFLSTHAHNFSRVKSLGRSIIFCSALDPLAKKCSFISHSGIQKLWLDISFHTCIYIHVALIFLSTHAHNFSRVKSLGRSIIFCSTLDTFFNQEM